LGTLGGNDAFAVLINESGDISGLSYTNTTANPTTGLPTVDPFFFRNGKMYDVGTLGGTFGQPTSMNDRGDVAGVSNLAGDSTAHPFLWSGGTLKDLGTLGGLNGTVNWINNAGDAVGKADLPGSLPQNHDAVLWSDGAVTDLGKLHGDSCANAYYINDHKQVVGTSENATLCAIPTGEHAFLWERDTGMIDLNTLIPANSSLQLVFAMAINDRGEIVGEGAPAGCTHLVFCGHAYVLVPCTPSASNPCAEQSPASSTHTVAHRPIAAADRVFSDGPIGTLDRIRARFLRHAHVRVPLLP
jgi:probable HAF family extracellular repeat protein